VLAQYLGRNENISAENMSQKLSKNQLSLYRKLSQRKYRRELGMFIVEGVRAVEQVMLRGVVQVEAVLRDSSVRADVFFGDVYEVDSDLFASLSDTEQSQGVLAICKVPESVDLGKVAELGRGVLVATDGIQDPGNLGTIYRTAAWFDTVGLLAGRGTVDVYNPKVVRSTAGATGVIPVFEVDLVETLTFLKDSGWEIILLDASDDAVSMEIVQFPRKVVLVVGNEGNGISADVLNRGFKRVFIPGNTENVESLNASVATSIALHEITRGKKSSDN
jgi:RNA methyltransferase, TrmH family